jgi:hypothetical protein
MSVTTVYWRSGGDPPTSYIAVVAAVVVDSPIHPYEAPLHTRRL